MIGLVIFVFQRVSLEMTGNVGSMPLAGVGMTQRLLLAEFIAAGPLGTRH